MYIWSIVPYSLMNSFRTRYDNKQRFGGKMGAKRLDRGGVHAMYSIEVALWLRLEQGYSSAQASTDRKTGKLSLPFYSIELSGAPSKHS